MDALLGFLKEEIAASVLSHILISLSYLSRDSFSDIKTQCKFSEKLQEFLEFYKKVQVSKSLS
jgi:hypothetical protein